MNFELLSTPQIMFGSGQFQKLGQLVRDFGSRLLVVASESALKDKNNEKTLVEALVEHNITDTRFIVKGEPTIEIIDQGVAVGMDFKTEAVIGFGGGSVLDAGKAIAGLITNGESAREYMEGVGRGLKITQSSLPYIAVPTTAGTGSEVTKNAVILAKDVGVKASIRSPLLVPKIALIDPSLMLSVPPEVTASCGLDAFTQLLEPYTSNKAQPITDALALLGIQRARNSLVRAYKQGNDLSARENMAMAALLSGICLANVGLGAVHGFASPLGGMFPIPHGVVCAALLAPTIQKNIEELKAKAPKNPNLLKYAKLAEITCNQTFSSINEAHMALTQYLRELTQTLKIPPLSKFGMKDSDIPTVIAKAIKSSSMKYNPIKLSESALSDILEQVL
ncbi:MAG: iron-containing alcohol dehydrogenase [Candidatus Hodarchaeota archaeon]